MTALRTILLASVALTMSTAAFAQDGLVLRIGIDGGENEADQLRRSECVAEPLKAATGVSEVQFFPSPDYNGIIQGLLGGTIDIAIMGASSYASIYLKDPEAVDPVLTTQQEDGSTGYHTIMVARSDSGITDLASSEGKKLGLIATGKEIANCCFGEDGRTLFLTSHDMVAKVRLKSGGW